MKYEFRIDFLQCENIIFSLIILFPKINLTFIYFQIKFGSFSSFADIANEG